MAWHCGCLFACCCIAVNFLVSHLYGVLFSLVTYAEGELGRSRIRNLTHLRSVVPDSVSKQYEQFVFRFGKKKSRELSISV